MNAFANVSVGSGVVLERELPVHIASLLPTSDIEI